MSLEAIQKVADAEQEGQKRIAEAHAEARQLLADAQKNGEALIKEVRAGAAEEQRKLMRQAEERAADKAAQIDRDARAEGDRLRQNAKTHLNEAADYIVRKVVGR
ncbi:MAG: hypothetical protein IJQ25_05505 [Oscillibacter sp.]|nr:hypothetical protein [Oscillibacter sp.]